MFNKLFGGGKKKDESADPSIVFGRYSDNNKSTGKITRWTEADNLFKEKNYQQAIDAFFDYLKDDTTANVEHKRNGNAGEFHLYQGSKIVRGHYDAENLVAEVTLAEMPQPNVPVMRRLLDMNFSLYYSRFALDGIRLCMRFDSSLDSANPNKLYYGLKELSIKADKQDDLLVQDFSALKETETDHIYQLPDTEKQVKYDYLIRWIGETLDYIKTHDEEKMSGGIAYLLLTLAFRLDYLLLPEGKLLLDIEKIIQIYFLKDERPTKDKNKDMIEAFEKIKSKSKDEVFPFFYRSKYTFSIVNPQHYKSVSDSIAEVKNNVGWYRENKYEQIAEKILEYGISYCQYYYSLPKPVTELYHIFIHINYSGYFESLGFGKKYYDKEKKKFFEREIENEVQEIVSVWKQKYPKLAFNHNNLRYDSLLNFNSSFVTEMEILNFDNN